MPIERTFTIDNDLARRRDPFFDEPNASHLRRAIADMDAGRNVVYHDIVEKSAPIHA